jgi:hypothetical protein
MVLFSRVACFLRLREELEPKPPTAVHGYRHTDHGVWPYWTVIKGQSDSWTVVDFIDAKLNYLLPYASLLLVQLLIYLDFRDLGWLLPASFIICLCNRTKRNFERQMQIADRCELVKFLNGAENSLLQALRLRQMSVDRKLSGGTRISNFLFNYCSVHD